MDGRRAGRGPLQLDIGIVVSGLGGNSSQERNQFNGLVSVFGVDLGLYIGPSYNPFQTIGPSIGIGVVSTIQAWNRNFSKIEIIPAREKEKFILT